MGAEEGEKETTMGRLSTVISMSLVSVMLVAATAACSNAAPATTKAPDKPAAGATSAPAAAAQPAASGGEIVIGMNVPITGGSSDQGALQLKSAKLAEKEINAAGGVNGKKIKVAPEDNQSTNPGALSALDKSIEQDKALVVLGPIMSTQIQAMSDSIKKYSVPWAAGGTAVKNTHMDNPWAFRLRPDDTIAAAAMVQYIKDDMKLTKIGILHDSDAFGSGGADLMEQYAKEAGLTIVKRERYTANDKDYTAQLLSLKSAGAEIMTLFAARPPDVAVIQRQVQQLGKPFKYIGTASSAAVDTVALSKEASVGLYAVMDFLPGSTDVSKKYEEAYRKEYNEKIDALTAWNYDAVKLFADVIKKVGEDRTKIKDAMLATKDWQGVGGTVSFTSNGDGLHESSVVEMLSGGDAKLMKVVKVKPQ
jgi:branched-chain amino acid transport system substrate-binding protein